MITTNDKVEVFNGWLKVNDNLTNLATAFHIVKSSKNFMMGICLIIPVGVEFTFTFETEQQRDEVFNMIVQDLKNPLFYVSSATLEEFNNVG